MATQDLKKIKEGVENVSSATTNSIPERVNDLITQLEKGEKPWFLKSAEIYKVAKNASQTIPLGSALFEQSLQSLSAVTKVIQENTKLRVAFDVEASHDLINQLDALLAQQLVFVDDGLDHARGRLALSLRLLLSAVVAHKDWALETARSQSAQASTAVRTRFEQALTVLTNILEVFKESYPHAFGVLHQVTEKVGSVGKDYQDKGKAVLDYAQGQAQQYVEDSKNRLLQLSESLGLLAAARWTLIQAQPYVHYSILQSQPYVNQALNLSQPYLEKAKPVIDPWVHRAKEINDNVLNHKVVGPYWTKACDSAELLLTETKEYCLPPALKEQQQQ